MTDSDPEPIQQRFSRSLVKLFLTTGRKKAESITAKSASFQKRSVKFNDFPVQCAVFTVEELDHFLSVRGAGSPNTRKSLLAHDRKQGRIVRVRRGLYATVPWDMDPASMVDAPFLVAAKMTEGAVLAHHTALEFHGKACPVHWRLIYVSAGKSLPLAFQSHDHRGIPVPAALRARASACSEATATLDPGWNFE